MKFLSIIVLAVMTLTGCASSEYKQYVDAQSKIEAQIATGKSNEAVAKHNADAAKYKAMADIAASGTESAKLVAVMALALGGQANVPAQAEPHTQLQAPPQNQALAWASVLLPSTVQLFGIASNTRLAMAQSDNAKDIALSTNGTFAGMGNNIQAAGAAGLIATQSTAASGFASAQAIANSGLSATQNTSTAGLTATQIVATNGMTSLVSVANAPVQTGKICIVNPITNVMSCN